MDTVVFDAESSTPRAADSLQGQDAHENVEDDGRLLQKAGVGKAGNEVHV